MSDAQVGFTKENYTQSCRLMETGRLTASLLSFEIWFRPSTDEKWNPEFIAYTGKYIERASHREMELQTFLSPLDGSCKCINIWYTASLSPLLCIHPDIRLPLPLSLSLNFFVSREFQRKVIVKMFALGVVMVGKLFFFTLISWMGLNISLSQPSQPSLAVRRAKIENAKTQTGKMFTQYRLDEKGKVSINISDDM